MTLLSYDEHWLLQSAVQVSTTGAVYADDTESIQVFNLAEQRTVFVMYVCDHNYGVSSDYKYREVILSIDGALNGFSLQSSGVNTRGQRNICVWVGTLAAGNHTIKAKFRCTAGFTVYINNRQLLILSLRGDEFRYAYSSTEQILNPANGIVDDASASFTFTPSSACKMLAIYSPVNWDTHGTTLASYSVINIGGVDYSTSGQTGRISAGKPENPISIYASSLLAVSTTVKGRFGAYGGVVCHCDTRWLAILLFKDSTILDIVEELVTTKSTTSSTLANDTPAYIARSTADTRHLMSFAQAFSEYNSGSASVGLKYGIMVDTVDRWNLRVNGNGSANNQQMTVVLPHLLTLTSGNHTIQGRYSNQDNASTEKVSKRLLGGLWLADDTIPTITAPTPISFSIGDSITITGTSFLSTQATGTVTVGGVAATVTAWNDTSITIIVPLTASGNIVVTNDLDLVSNSWAFTIASTSVVKKRLLIPPNFNTIN